MRLAITEFGCRLLEPFNMSHNAEQGSAELDVILF